MIGINFTKPVAITINRSLVWFMCEPDTGKQDPEAYGWSVALGPGSLVHLSKPGYSIEVNGHEYAVLHEPSYRPFPLPEPVAEAAPVKKKRG